MHNDQKRLIARLPCLAARLGRGETPLLVAVDWRPLGSSLCDRDIDTINAGPVRILDQGERIPLRTADVYCTDQPDDSRFRFTILRQGPK